MSWSQVNLTEMLEARDRRVEIQQRMLDKWGSPLLCLTMNIPGPVKRTPAIRWLFEVGRQRILQWNFSLLEEYVSDNTTGCEVCYALKAEAEAVKEKAVALEDAFPAARLYDLDVLNSRGQKLSRASQRRCLVCEKPAAECARSRAHGLDNVLSVVHGLLGDFVAAQLAEEAHAALLGELYTTPKPGLVDRANNGAHSDMSLALFERSAAALHDYFLSVAQLGWQDSSMSEMRALGQQAEERMFVATGGVNTHKGMVYSMGLLLWGMARTLCCGGTAVERAAELARADAEARLAEAWRNPQTHGARAFRQHGARGALGEAAAGFPHARQAAELIGRYRALQVDGPEALALNDLMAELEDTNLLHRGGPEGLEFVRTEARAIAQLPYAERLAALVRLDTACIARHLSPGGSADMLALGLLLRTWEDLQPVLRGSDM